MKRHKRMKGLVALFLAAVMVFGLAPKLDTSAATKTIKLGATMEKGGVISSFGTLYTFTTPEGDTSMKWLKFKLKYNYAFYTLKVTNVSVENGVCVSTGVPVNGSEAYLYVDEGQTQVGEFYQGDPHAKGQWVYIGINTARQDLKGRVRIQITAKADLEGYTQDQAKALSLKTVKKGRVDGYADTDYFKFKCTASGKYRVTFKNVDLPGKNSNIYVRCNADLAKGSNAIGYVKKGKTSTAVYTMFKGRTYYFSVETNNEKPNTYGIGYRGNYTIKIQKK